MALAWRVACVLAAVGAVQPTTADQHELTDVEYHGLPRLFHMDDYAACVGAGGSYCLGTFLLRPRTPAADHMFQRILEYSSGRYHFNRTMVHRGYCVTSRCRHAAAPHSPRAVFARCVSDAALHRHGFQTTLLQLNYCEHARTHHRPYDGVERGFAWLVGLIGVFNIIGTAYDLLRNKDFKPNKYLIAWSLRENWNRLFATYENGDPRLTALRSVQGIRAFTMALVLLAHSMIVHHMAYIQNPDIIERNGGHWLSTIFHNGSVVVQVFFLLSSFLFSYNLLLLAEKNKKRLSLCMLPQCLLHRIIRILPLQLFVLWLTAGWWARAGQGALWTPLVRRQAAACRRRWWTHALFLNNLLYPDDKCLMQTWFLAADMQLYVVAAALTLTLARRRRAVAILATLFIGSVAANFLVAYYFQLKPIMLLMNPEVVRSEYVGEASFKWLYSAPWGSLPACLLGVGLAFLLAAQPPRPRRPDHTTVFRVAYAVFFPALVLWVVGGYLVRDASPVGVAAYAAVDRAGFALIAAVGLIGFFNNVDGVWKRFFEWRGWMPLGRMSLAVLLVHWNYNLTHIALRSQPSTVAVYEVGGHWHSVHFMSYATAIPLHLAVELPTQRFLQALFF